MREAITMKKSKVSCPLLHLHQGESTLIIQLEGTTLPLVVSLTALLSVEKMEIMIMMVASILGLEWEVEMERLECWKACDGAPLYLL